MGAVYLSASATDPATLFGGTWERIQGRFLLAASGSYAAGSTGGEATHTLTVDEMPSHSHTFRAAMPGATNSDPVFGSNGGGTYSTNATGGGAAHNNMPPYLAVYMWERVA